jgi:hypothetical protein
MRFWADYSEPFDDNFDDNGLVFDDNWLVVLSPTCANRVPIKIVHPSSEEGLTHISQSEN